MPRALLRSRPAASDAGAAEYASAAVPRRSVPWRAASWVALDFELTGLDPRRDEIISFGAIPIDSGRVQLGAAVSALVRPTHEIGEASIRVHGIRAADLARAPSLRESIGVLLGAIAGRAVVAHSAHVERAFLKRALREHGLRMRGQLVDTELLGRLWLHQRDGRWRGRLSLSELAGELGLPAERPHDALADALTTAQVFIALATYLDGDRPETVGSLSRGRLRLDALRVFHAG